MKKAVEGGRILEPVLKDAATSVVSLKIQSKIKHLGTNLTKKAKHLHTGNYRAVLKETKRRKCMESHLTLTDWKTILLRQQLNPEIYRFSALYISKMHNFCRIENHPTAAQTVKPIIYKA